jgi:AcrR family transcriptional regulator
MNPLREPLASPASAVPSSSRHERVLNEAARQLNAKGVSLTSLAEIAAQLGVSRAALYYYVEDRDDLVFQCYRRSCEVTARHLTAAHRDGGDAHTIITNFVRRTLDPAEPETAARAEIAMMSAAQRDTIQGLYDALATRLGQILAAGEREGRLRACDVEVNARAILSLLAWVPLSRHWSIALNPVEHSRLVETVLSIIFDGVAASRELPSFKTMDLEPLSTRNSGVFDREADIGTKRDALIVEASRLFNRKGIDATSLEEIAAQVGATKRTLHRHLGSKQDLVAACYERAFAIFLFVGDRMRDYAGSRCESFASAFHALAIAYPREDLSPLSPLVGYGALSSQAQARFNAHSVQLATGYYEAVKRGIDEGSIRNIDIDAHVVMLLGLLSWLVKDDVPTDAAKREQIAVEIANLVAIGLSANN